MKWDLLGLSLSRHKLQSAMEYLMTYGWAILIIAVVLGAIYSLGLFNGANLGPKSQPGSCEVLRPNGPGTIQYISLAGSCINQLPLYTPQFDGQTASITAQDSAFLDPTNSVTMVAWVNTHYMAAGYRGVVSKTTDWGGLTTGYGIRTAGTYQQFQPWVGNGVTTVAPQITITANVWHQIAFTYISGTGGIVYLDGAQVNTMPSIGLIASTTAPVYIGNSINSAHFNGSASNIQIYNTSLDANSIKALYIEGIGGAPINLQSLVGWWPLNGNTNDYSGNIDNGAPTNVIYTSQWQSGYNTP